MARHGRSVTNARAPAGSGGFTLIEVLVALAIVAFGLIAVFGQLSQSAMAASRLRDKTLAHWVAVNALTEWRLRGALPGSGVQSETVEMAGRQWRYEVTISETTSDALRRLDVMVATEEDPERPLARTIGFVGEPSSPAINSGWPLVSPDNSTPPSRGSGGATDNIGKPR